MSGHGERAATPTGGVCLARTVADAMEEEPSIEAVTFLPEALSIATLGHLRDPEATARLARRIQDARKSFGARPCELLEGKPECRVCTTPLTPMQRQILQVRRDSDSTTISRVTCPTAPRFWRWHEFPLPRWASRELEIPQTDFEVNEWKWQLLAAALCGLLGIGAAWFADGFAQTLLFLGSYLAGGWFAAHETWERLRERKLDVHFLMLLVAAGSASIGGWGEGAVLLFLFSLSGALEHFALNRTQREIHALLKAAPKTAWIIDSTGHEREVPVSHLNPGMIVMVKPGGQFPVDGEVIDGASAADESNITGEAIPVEKHPGDTALAGTINLWGAVKMAVLRPASESALEKIVRMIREAQKFKAPSQRFTDRFGTGYTYLILTLTLAMFFVWWLALGWRPWASTPDHPSAFYHAMTLLVVASPCALVLSIPSAILAAIAAGARRGVLFRGGGAVEKLAEIGTVALDKTGTLTTGELKVERVESFPPGREMDVLKIAYALEKLSTHPLARAVTRHGKGLRLEDLKLMEFEAVSGQGLRALHEGTECRLGQREWLRSSAFPCEAPQEPGLSEIWIQWGDLQGRILLRDDVRPEARGLLESLRRRGLKTVVLTGDRKSVADKLQEQVGADAIRAELKPEQKVEAILQFSREGRPAAMIGDGVNDAPSLAAAHVGVAMGARGSDAALEQAEVILMHDRLENFLFAFELSRRARSIIRQNLVISLGTVATLVVLAILGIIPLTAGVIGHEGSTVVVVTNSLRLLFRRKTEG